jgi:hypothetical protein
VGPGAGGVRRVGGWGGWDWGGWGGWGVLTARFAVNLPGVPLHLTGKARREADRRAGLAMATLLDPAGRAEVDQFLARGKPIMAIKRVRELTGLRLLDARRMVDSIQR